MLQLRVKHDKLKKNKNSNEKHIHFTHWQVDHRNNMLSYATQNVLFRTGPEKEHQRLEIQLLSMTIQTMMFKPINGYQISLNKDNSTAVYLDK